MTFKRFAAGLVLEVVALVAAIIGGAFAIAAVLK